MEVLHRRPYALSICAAIAMLAGCNSAALAPTQGSGLAPSGTPLVSSVAHGAADSHRGKNTEKLKSTSGTEGGSGCQFLCVSGKARGPYPGTFTGFGDFSWTGSHAPFFGEFVITSGTNTITGGFSGTGYFTCGRGGCSGSGKMTYTATLGPGSKTFSGKGKVEVSTCCSTVSMNITLHSM